ncbi:hypothetical protein RHSIM_Rhsim09G0123300 [Rhododendron simsii]|uniref:Uncharacterized protein n=1 Tax=Rhododendron simsii TaxID=118357 RepID=A0A834GIS5_RHOSS|nr:hypothetical protein RHSIM_Rhsim09G0123300 [Rhododendron simsii]
MGNTESNESNTAGSSEDNSARRRRENIAAAVDAATTVAAVVAAGWAAAKLLSSSASEDENTNERGKMMEAAGSSRGGYPIPNQAAGRFESHQIPRIKFEDFPSDSVMEMEAKGEQRENEVIPSSDESRSVGDDHHLVLSGVWIGLISQAIGSSSPLKVGCDALDF